MLKLKKKFHSRRRLHSASSSVVGGSITDLDDRVVMLCEEIPCSYNNTTTSTSNTTAATNTTSTATDTSLDAGRGSSSSYHSYRHNKHKSSTLGGGGGGGGGRIRSSQSCSQIGGHQSESVVHLSRDRPSCRQACYEEREAPGGRRAYYVGRIVEMYVCTFVCLSVVFRPGFLIRCLGF